MHREKRPYQKAAMQIVEIEVDSFFATSGLRAQSFDIDNLHVNDVGDDYFKQK
ncbi:MAG: hypothetical protein HUK20_07090 [Fibrobacter sp.]|nr:hypothetical protein [Fibrobacter sp.]